MAAPLVPDDDIPALAAKLGVPMIKALRRASQVDFVPKDGSIDVESAKAYGSLADLHCVDVGQSGPITLHWIITGSGKKVLAYIDARHADDHADDAPPDTSGTWLGP